MERQSRSELIFKIFAVAVVTIFGLLALYPMVYSLSASISGKVAYEAGRVVLFPKDVTFQVYELIYEDKGLWISFTNTLFYTVFGTAWSIFITALGAYALSKKHLLFRIVFLLLNCLPLSRPTFLNQRSFNVLFRNSSAYFMAVSALS